ncbi:unnamed protein product [Acanthoscelides obtectus]|uniref:Uncharacterized protein n=1 Tax=Acanthoscelides obtectus TaxID=200917 RepID=A0A9P0L7U0_ACAOB|nr:unnamed protein product [Acanthoscelides obtectus]CAK1653123.1 hypothetical protein AOBTE_LOCUS18075 [Acanthoscelides obtectus]
MLDLIDDEEISSTHSDTDVAILEGEHEEIQPQLDDMIQKSNSMNERLISLRAMSEKLKQQIKEEKVKWRQELAETAALDRNLREAHKKGPDGYQMFRDYLFFAETSRTIDEAMRKKHYEQWLNEIEHECNDELEKITKSITRLKPLKDIVLEWDMEKGSGDHADQKKQRSKPTESDDELEATSSKITITNMPVDENDTDRTEEDTSNGEESTDEDKTVIINCFSKK